MGKRPASPSAVRGAAAGPSRPEASRKLRRQAHRPLSCTPPLQHPHPSLAWGQGADCEPPAPTGPSDSRSAAPASVELELPTGPFLSSGFFSFLDGARVGLAQPVSSPPHPCSSGFPPVLVTLLWPLWAFLNRVGLSSLSLTFPQVSCFPLALSSHLPQSWPALATSWTHLPLVSCPLGREACTVAPGPCQPSFWPRDPPACAPPSRWAPQPVCSF